MSLPKKITLIIIAIFVLATVSVFVRNILLSQDTSLNQVDTSDLSAERITIQEKYLAGTHTLFGVIPTPTPCHEVSLNATRDTENRNLYHIDITTTETGDACAQVITDQIFEYSFEATREIQLKGTLDGSEVIFNRIQLPADEDFVNPIEYTKG